MKVISSLGLLSITFPLPLNIKLVRQDVNIVLLQIMKVNGDKALPRSKNDKKKHQNKLLNKTAQHDYSKGPLTAIML